MGAEPEPKVSRRRFLKGAATTAGLFLVNKLVPPGTAIAAGDPSGPDGASDLAGDPDATQPDAAQPGANAPGTSKAEQLAISKYDWTNLRILRIGAETKAGEIGNPERDQVQTFFAGVAKAMEEKGHPKLNSYLDMIYDASVAHTYSDAASKPNRLMMGYVPQAEMAGLGITLPADPVSPFKTGIARTLQNPDGVSFTLEVLIPAISTTDPRFEYNNPVNNPDFAVMCLAYKMRLLSLLMEQANTLRSSGTFNRENFMKTAPSGTNIAALEQVALQETIKIYRELGLLGSNTPFFDEVAKRTALDVNPDNDPPTTTLIMDFPVLL